MMLIVYLCYVSCILKVQPKLWQLQYHIVIVVTWWYYVSFAVLSNVYNCKYEIDFKRTIREKNISNQIKE